MDLRENTKIVGAVNGLWEGQFPRLDELNDRLAGRQFPDRPLQPNFGMRPVPTKYALFPVIDRRAGTSVPIEKHAAHNPYTNFSPATSNGPVAGYLANVDMETILQNRNVRLQHGADQGVYVPSSKSDLYGFQAVGREETMGERGLLFERHALATKQSDVAHQIGRDIFHNNTRTQLRGL
jgi:hypothetical protein